MRLANPFCRFLELAGPAPSTPAPKLTYAPLLDSGSVQGRPRGSRGREWSAGPRWPRASSRVRPGRRSATGEPAVTSGSRITGARRTPAAASPREDVHLLTTLDVSDSSLAGSSRPNVCTPRTSPPF